MITDIKKICHLGSQVITEEAEAIANLKNRINEKFAAACQLLFNCHGRIVVTGMGKSGHIANKIAATLASTGSPSFFLHPAEAGHGDLGNITKNDTVIAISGSGNTPEILAILPIIQYLGVPLITLTGNPNSNLAKMSDVNLDVSVTKEADPLGLAPTSSTTAALAMGDALAITLLEMRGFTAKDFARNHPGGIIGKKLCLIVDNIMRTGNDIPKVNLSTSIVNALVEMSQKRMGMTLITNEQNEMVGIYTDGDLRRTLDKKIDIYKTSIEEVMTKSAKTIPPNTLAIEALQIMEQFRITSLIIAKDKSNVPLGVIHIHDLLREGVG